MDNPQPATAVEESDGGAIPPGDIAAPGPLAAEACSAADDAALEATVGADGGRAQRRARRRVVVCCGVRGVFAPDAGGVWRLSNGAELRVLEGLGGSKSGAGRLRGLDAALEAGLAGPGDLRRLAERLDQSGGIYRSDWAMVAGDLEVEGLAAAFTVACTATGELHAAR